MAASDCGFIDIVAGLAVSALKCAARAANQSSSAAGEVGNLSRIASQFGGALSTLATNIGGLFAAEMKWKAEIINAYVEL